ncbi:hypothetical protein Lepto7375DRAFT_1787 [Leptolyngbya sp. PCC 7375]|nr:hypothetical protein Lepto7375DRAFT_1787 [Leptolyngbya sp. PCC 7375]
MSINGNWMQVDPSVSINLLHVTQINWVTPSVKLTTGDKHSINAQQSTELQRWIKGQVSSVNNQDPIGIGGLGEW